MKNLDEPLFMQLCFDYGKDKQFPPFIFMPFVNDIGKEITICILLNWHEFYECNLALVKSDFDNKPKAVEEILDEFHWQGSSSLHILGYLMKLRTDGVRDSQKLVLRSDTLAKYLYALDDVLDDLFFPPSV